MIGNRQKIKIGGRELLAHSNYEVNFARYLDYLQKNKKIENWIKNTTHFYFKKGIDVSDIYKRQKVVKSYIPDFIIFYKDGKTEFIEVKGWMKDKDKRQIERFKKEYKGVCLKLFMKEDLIKIQKEVLSGKIKIKDWIKIR